MTESEFLALAEATLARIEVEVERVMDAAEIDVECSRNGNVLEIEFIDNGAKIIINSQAPLQEMWVAARSGGFHFRRDGHQWRNTRDGTELFVALSAIASQQAGTTLDIT